MRTIAPLGGMRRKSSGRRLDALVPDEPRATTRIHGEAGVASATGDPTGRVLATA